MYSAYTRRECVQASFLSIFIFACTFTPEAQTLGGNSVFNFLNLPNTPQLTALGGINVSAITQDIGLSFNNPSLLREDMHGQFTAVFNSMYAGIKNYHAMLGFYNKKLVTNFAAGIFYFDYGSISQTDASGNVMGTFHPVDYVAQLSASRKYLAKWNYGATVKFLNSNYGLYRSNGIALDAGAAYYDSAKLFQFSLVAKNMGVQLKKYAGSAGDELPFDMQIGITKRLEKAPIQFSVTAHHIYRFDVLYRDTAFNNANNFDQNNGKKNLAIDKFFRHFVFATQVFIGDKIEITGAYNHLRRAELNISNSANGLNGFSIGAGVLFAKIQIRYARAYYQSTSAYNQLGINLILIEYFSLGNFGEKAGW